MDVLIGAGLAAQEAAGYRLTKAGQILKGRAYSSGIRGLALALIRAGYFHDQARTLLDMGASQADGSILIRPLATARRACPQLTGLLLHWPEVATARQVFRIPSDLVEEMGAGWALLPPPEAGQIEAALIRKTVGNRGELYSYQFEKLRAASPSDIVWVSQDNEALGYDVEDRSERPYRRIEVKASGGRLIRFFLSDNEFGRAHDDPERYEVQFWGGIDLGSNPADEFRRLRQQSYPIIFRDLPTQLGTGALVATPTQWLCTTPEPS